MPHGDDVGRRAGSSTASVAGNGVFEVCPGGVADNTNRKSTTDEEESKTEVDRFEGGPNVGARTLSFSRDHGDKFVSDDGESSRPERRKKSFETSERAALVLVFERFVDAFPVSESVCVVLRVATDHRNERVEEEGEDLDDLATSEPELCFTGGFDSEDVDCTRPSQLSSVQGLVRSSVWILVLPI